MPAVWSGQDCHFARQRAVFVHSGQELESTPDGRLKQQTDGGDRGSARGAGRGWFMRPPIPFTHSLRLHPCDRISPGHPPPTPPLTPPHGEGAGPQALRLAQPPEGRGLCSAGPGRVRFGGSVPAARLVRDAWPPGCPGTPESSGGPSGVWRPALRAPQDPAGAPAAGHAPPGDLHPGDSECGGGDLAASPGHPFDIINQPCGRIPSVHARRPRH